MLTAVVTGASSGIGEGIIRKLLSEVSVKWRVVMIARRVGKMNKIAMSCIPNASERNKRVKIIGFDLYDSKAVMRNVIPQIKQFTNCVDLLINNAGNPFAAGKDVSNIDLDTMQKELNLYLLTPFIFIKHLEKELSVSKYPASVITISGTGAQNVLPSFVGYCIAARAAKALTQSYAIYYGEQYGIRVNGIDLGVIDTPIFTKNMSNAERNEFFKAMIDLTPLKKNGTIKDAVDMIMFLSDPNKSSFVTGQHFTVDGGFTVPFRAKL
eukprot:251751_1